MAGTKVKVKVTQGSRPSVPHGTNFYLYLHDVVSAVFAMATCPSVYLSQRFKAISGLDVTVEPLILVALSFGVQVH